MRYRILVGPLSPANALERGWSATSVIIRRMRAGVLREYCLSFPESLETFPFGPKTSVFKVADKMFALSQLARRPLRISVKCEPELAEQLREAHPAVLPGYHLNKKHWNTVLIDGSLPEQMIMDMIEDSYDLIVSQLPESRRRSLGWQTSESPPPRPRGRGGART
jgi:predicted DNA-binding protein (MmcQ/YjbR family)